MSAGGRGEKPTCIRVITISAGPRWRQENKQRVRVRQSRRERESRRRDTNWKKKNPEGIMGGGGGGFRPPYGGG